MSASILTDPRFEQSDGEKLGHEITELCGYIYAATHHLLELIREFDEQQYWGELGFQSCAHWLNFKCGFGMNSARERIRVAHALGKLPKIDEAFSRGALSYSKARAITRVADERNEDYLLMVATHGTAHHVERLVAQYRRAKKLQDAHLENGPHVAAETSRRIACDCSTTIINEDEQGELLSIGRRSRSIPPAMRRALKARDGGCRFPGCTNHKFVDGHHIIHWADGGETSVVNVVLLCRDHHHLVHEGGFACKRGKDGEIWFEDRNGRRLDDVPTPQSVDLEESLAFMYRKFEDRNVSAVTPVAKWYAGEQMDWDHAVALMFPSAGPDP